MSDTDIADEIPAVPLTAVAVIPQGNGFALAFMGHDGQLTAYTLSAAKLRQVHTVIGDALVGKLAGVAGVHQGFFPEG